MIINLVVLHSGSSWTEGTWRPSKPKRLICEYLFLKGSRCTHSPFSCAVVHYIDVSLSLQGEKGNSGPPGQKGPKGSEGNQGNRGQRGGKGPPGKQVITFFHSLVSKWPLVTCVGADNVFAKHLVLKSQLTIWCRDTEAQWAAEEYQGLQDRRSVSGRSNFRL